MNKKRMLLVALIVVCAALTIMIYPLISDFNASDSAKLEEFLQRSNNWLADFGIFRYLALFIIQILQVIVAIIPGEPIELLAGFAIGTIGGTLLCIVGSAVGAIIIFWGVHKYGGRFIAFFTGNKYYDKLSFLKDPVRRDMLFFILFLIPGTPKDLLLYFSPLTNITLWRMVSIISIARIPSIMSSAYVGAHVSEGEFGHSILVFAITGIIGLLGILLNDFIIQSKKTKE